MLRAIPLLGLAVLVGCGDGKPTCEQAAAHSVRVIRSELGEYDQAKLDNREPEVRASMMRSCKEKKYTGEHIQCYLDSKTRAELEACDTQHL